ncbi:hypothetical protein UFOVP679_58 [uncultured Caudovirales phage]|uniref:Major tropism determinant N-terminal domain-containing protein n=1 Tax=uncultured Caudovirales phage TaxID=2100421 RepID=A0A6J5NG96_9CAUD|nr:hypothetical protein UFOVP679_58 [uncultured Caudovirales phage]
MPSSYTTRNRLNKQATGEATNTWGTVLNSGGLDLIDFAADGITTISSAGATTLTTANGSTDQARARILNITATTAATVTIPALEKLYLVRNAASNADHIITNGSSSVTIYAGEIVPLITNGTTVWRFALRNVEGAKLTNLGAPTTDTDAATKKYVDDTAFSSSTTLPGQTGNAGKFVTTNGTTASWADAIPPLVVKTTTYTAVARDRLLADTTGGAFTITLPASPASGDEVFIADGGVTPSSAGWGGNNLTIGRNGSTIGGLAENLTCRTRGAAIRLTYLSGTWKVTG